ncbi:MAG: metallopeptidase [Firmicutes bacterium]|nr:metallopeptidase [Bacillota bacterium]
MADFDVAEIKRRTDSVAKDILSAVKSRLLLDFRFLDTAIGRLDLLNDDMIFQLATDGQRLYFCSPYVLAEYKNEQEALNRAYLHTVLHCIFRHMFVSPEVNKELWNISADIAVENILNSLNAKCIKCGKTQYQSKMLHLLKKDIKPFTAERIYKHFIDKNYTSEETEKIKGYFQRDNHELWWPDSENGEKPENTDERQQKVDPETLLKEWEEISKMLDVDLETLSKDTVGTGDMSQNLKALNRDKYDYRQFLRRFSVRGEDLIINDEEFDYIYYTYGLEKYGNMPLVEPLEYKDTEKICDFVVAIDTSGSVKGELVQRFLDKTYSILMMEESFFKKINLRIIQCDSEMQEEVVVTNKDEFEKYMHNMKLKGFGGTDFRPVFKRVEELIEAKEFKKFKGLIYFTDGYGTYPEKKPPFEAAFIYLGYDAERPKTPVWAIKLVLEEDQLAEDLK